MKRKEKILFGILVVLVMVLAGIVAFRTTEQPPEETEAPAVHPPVKELSAAIAAPQTVKTASETLNALEAWNYIPTEKTAQNANNGVVARGNDSIEIRVAYAAPQSGEPLKPSERDREPYSPPEQRSKRTETKADTGLRLLGTYSIKGYDTCAYCCGKTDGITASGAAATVGRTCASNDFPLGTVLYIEGIGYRTVEDRGGMARGVIDVLCADHPACYAITGNYAVYIAG